jgi:integrase
VLGACVPAPQVDEGPSEGAIEKDVRKQIGLVRRPALGEPRQDALDETQPSRTKGCRLDVFSAEPTQVLGCAEVEKGDRDQPRLARGSQLPVLGRLRLDKISGEVVARLFARLRTKLPDKKALAEKTIKNVRATLRRILASAKEWGEIPAIPDLPRVKVPESSWNFFTWEETQRLLAACRDEEERALLMFAVHTGARAGEQLALSWGDIDWHNHLVVFRRSSTRGIVEPTKSGRERKVPLTGKLEAALRRIKHLRSDRCSATRTDPS